MPGNLRQVPLWHKQSQLISTVHPTSRRAGRACIWRAECDGRTFGAHHRTTARPSENRDDESGVQHDALGAIAQAGREDGGIGAPAGKCCEKQQRLLGLGA